MVWLSVRVSSVHCIKVAKCQCVHVSCWNTLIERKMIDLMHSFSCATVNIFSISSRVYDSFWRWLFWYFCVCVIPLYSRSNNGIFSCAKWKTGGSFSSNEINSNVNSHTKTTRDHLIWKFFEKNSEMSELGRCGKRIHCFLLERFFFALYFCIQIWTSGTLFVFGCWIIGYCPAGVLGVILVYKLLWISVDSLL